MNPLSHHLYLHQKPFWHSRRPTIARTLGTAAVVVLGTVAGLWAMGGGW